MSGATEHATDDHHDAAASGSARPASAPAVVPGSDAMHRAIVQTSVNPFVVLDGNGYVTWVSDRVRALLGGAPETYVGRHFLDMLDPSARDAALAEYAEFVDRDSQRRAWIGPPMLLELVHDDGSRITCEVSAASGQDEGIDGIIVQVRRWRGTVLLYSAVDALAAGAPLPPVLQKLAAIAEHDMPGSVVFVAAGWDGERFELVEPAPGTRPEHLALTDRIATLPNQRWMPTGGGPPALDQLAAEAGLASGWSIPITVRGDAEPSAALVLLRPVPIAPAPHNTTVQRVATLVALAIESDRNRRAWRRSAITDHLTELANRAGLDEWLSRRAATSPDHEIAVLFCDVDEFKQVNDERGHAVGDRILKVVAERMRRLVRDEDLVARWGGDEFVVVCADPSAAETLAQRLIDHVREPIGIDDGTATVGLSVGISFGTCATSLDDLLRDSDRALLEAKVAGRNRLVVHG